MSIRAAIVREIDPGVWVDLSSWDVCYSQWGGTFDEYVTDSDFEPEPKIDPERCTWMPPANVARWGFYRADYSIGTFYCVVYETTEGVDG